MSFRLALFAALAFLALTLSPATPAHAWILNQLGRSSGLGYGDGYHARTRYPRSWGANRGTQREWVGPYAPASRDDYWGYGTAAPGPAPIPQLAPPPEPNHDPAAPPLDEESLIPSPSDRILTP